MTCPPILSTGPTACLGLPLYPDRPSGLAATRDGKAAHVIDESEMPAVAVAIPVEDALASCSARSSMCNARYLREYELEDSNFKADVGDVR